MKAKLLIFGIRRFKSSSGYGGRTIPVSVCVPKNICEFY